MVNTKFQHYKLKLQTGLPSNNLILQYGVTNLHAINVNNIPTPKVKLAYSSTPQLSSNRYLKCN